MLCAPYVPAVGLHKGVKKMSEGLKHYIKAILDAETGFLEVPRGTSAEKKFPKFDEKVEPHIDEEQGVVYEVDEKCNTVTTLL